MKQTQTPSSTEIVEQDLIDACKGSEGWRIKDEQSGPTIIGKVTTYWLEINEETHRFVVYHDDNNEAYYDGHVMGDNPIAALNVTLRREWEKKVLKAAEKYREQCN